MNFDFTAGHGLSLMAIGGVLAAVVSGWRQIQGFFRQITAVVIVEAEIEHGLSYTVRQYLRLNFRQVPSGIMVIAYAQYQLTKEAFQTKVPFHVPNLSGLMFNRRGLMHVAMQPGGTMKIRTLRGTHNIKKIVTQAVDLERQQQQSMVAKRIEQSGSNRADRFYVERVMGSEKTPGFSMPSQSVGNQSASDSAAPSSGGALTTGDGNQMKFMLDYQLDKSFMFEESEYRKTYEFDPMQGLYFEPEVVEHFEYAKRWLGMGDWYQERGIPWRRGWLLYGPGGTGKSSIARALGRVMRVPVYQYFLGTLSDQEFTKAWDSMSTPCVALFEDFDSVFDGRTPMTEHKSLTFDTVLNTLSGVESRSGVFVVITTNFLDKIDPAMGVSQDSEGTLSTRPGRIDTVLRIGEMGEDNRRKLLTNILRDWPEDIERLVQASVGMTPSQVQEMAVQEAYKHLSVKDEKNEQPERPRLVA